LRWELLKEQVLDDCVNKEKEEEVCAVHDHEGKRKKKKKKQWVGENRADLLQKGQAIAQEKNDVLVLRKKKVDLRVYQIFVRQKGGKKKEPGRTDKPNRQKTNPQTPGEWLRGSRLKKREIEVRAQSIAGKNC